MSIVKEGESEREYVEMKSSGQTVAEEERKNEDEDEDSAVIVMERSNSSGESDPSAPEPFLKQEEEKFGDPNKGMISQTISQVVDIPQNPNIIVPLDTNKDNNTPLDIPDIPREYTIPDEWIMDDTHETHYMPRIEKDHGKVAPDFYPAHPIIVPLKDNNSPVDITSITREYTIPDEWIMDDTHKTHNILPISGIENDYGKVAPNFYPTKKVLSRPELLPELVIAEDSMYNESRIWMDSAVLNQFDDIVDKSDISGYGKELGEEWFEGSPRNLPPKQKKRRKKRTGASPPEGKIISPYRLEVPKRMIPKAKKTKKVIKGEEINQTNQNKLLLPPIIFPKDSIRKSGEDSVLISGVVSEERSIIDAEEEADLESSKVENVPAMKNKSRFFKVPLAKQEEEKKEAEEEVVLPVPMMFTKRSNQLLRPNTSSEYHQSPHQT